MSTQYWICEGIGIRANRLFLHLNAEKCIALVKEQLGNGFEEPSVEQFNIHDYLYGYLFEDIADMLCQCDDTHTLTFGDSGDGECFFYYPPSYPWSRNKNEPTSIEEVHKRIKKAVLRICDLSDAEIESMIDDDLYEVGCD